MYYKYYSLQPRSILEDFPVQCALSFHPTVVLMWWVKGNSVQAQLHLHILLPRAAVHLLSRPPPPHVRPITVANAIESKNNVKLLMLMMVVVVEHQVLNGILTRIVKRVIRDHLKWNNVNSRLKAPQMSLVVEWFIREGCLMLRLFLVVLIVPCVPFVQNWMSACWYVAHSIYLASSLYYI